MRLSLSGFYPVGDQYVLLYSNEKVVGRRGVRFFVPKKAHEYPNVSIVKLQIQHYVVYCTPRCYTTGGWEVGVNQCYDLTYLIGSNSPTSFDMNVLQVFDQLIVVLQTLMIKYRHGSLFYIPNVMVLQKECKQTQYIPLFSPMIQEMQKLCNAIGRVLSISTCRDADHAQLLDVVQTLKSRYFQDLHMDLDRSSNSEHRYFLKLLGQIQSRLMGLYRKEKLTVRQYLRGSSSTRKVKY